MAETKTAQETKEEGMRLFHEGLYDEAAAKFEKARELFAAEGDETKEAAIERILRSNKLKVSQIYSKKLLGPAAIEKIIGKKHELMTTIVEKPPGKPKLVPGTDKREPITVKADDEFDDLPDEEG